MGYTTDFSGSFKLSKQLTPGQIAYLTAFAGSRRMRREQIKARELTDPVRLAVNLPIGVDGEYYVGSAESNMGQVRDASVIDYNNPASTQPGLWCQWVPSDDGMEIKWNGFEKFYNYREWMQYLIDNFLTPWGIEVSGEVEWQGEDSSDVGRIRIDGTNVIADDGTVIYGDQSDVSGASVDELRRYVAYVEKSIEDYQMPLSFTQWKQN